MGFYWNWGIFFFNFLFDNFALILHYAFKIYYKYTFNVLSKFNTQYIFFITISNDKIKMQVKNGYLEKLENAYNRISYLRKFVNL